MTLFDLSPADFRRFLTVPVDRRILGSQCCLSTGLVANGIRLTKRCIALSPRSWQVFHIVGLCVFSHQSADYSTVVGPIALKDIPVVCMPNICHLCASDIRLRIMLTENEYKILKHRT